MERTFTIRVISKNLVAFFKIIEYALKDIVIARRLRSKNIEL